MDSKERKGNGLRQTISLEKPLHLLPLPQPEALVVLSSPRRMPQVLLPLLSRVRQQLPLPHRQRKPLRLTQRVVKPMLHLLPLPQPEALVVLSSPRRMPQGLLPLLSRVRQQLPLPHRQRKPLRLTQRVVKPMLHHLPLPHPQPPVTLSSRLRTPSRKPLPLARSQRRLLPFTPLVRTPMLHLLPLPQPEALVVLSSPRRMPQGLLPLLSRVRQQLPLPHRQRKPLRLTQRVVNPMLH